MTLSAFFKGNKKQPDINFNVRQYRINYLNNEVVKNGKIVADNLVGHVSGGAHNKINDATYKGRNQFITWLKQDKMIFSDGKITDHQILVSGSKAAILFYLGRYP